jgi:protein TonB
VPTPPKKIATASKPKLVPTPPVETPASIPFDSPPSFVTTPTTDVAPAASTMPAGRAGPPPDYLTQVRLRLEQNKTYPRMAEMRRQEGEVMLRFTIDRDGHVLSHVIDRSSGYTVLDRETESMLARSDPLPPVPQELTGTTFEIVVPVQFELSDASHH